MNQSSSRSRDIEIESGRSIWSETPVGALQEIAMKFGTKVIRYNLPMIDYCGF